MIAFEADSPNFIQRLEERLFLDTVRIEPALIWELLEPGPPALPGLPSLIAGFRGTCCGLHLLAKGLGDQVAERTLLLSGKRFCFP